MRRKLNFCKIKIVFLPAKVIVCVIEEKGSTTEKQSCSQGKHLFVLG